MNSFRLTVTLLALIGLCCSQFVSADISDISKFIDSKELRRDETAQNQIDALHEMHQQMNSGLQKFFINKKTSHLLDQMLEAASWVEQKNCNDETYEFRFDRDFRQSGTASVVLTNVLNRRDYECAKKLIEKEKPIYRSLDEEKKAKIEKLAGLTREHMENNAFDAVQGFDGLKAISILGYDPYNLDGLECYEYYDSILALLLSASKKKQCKHSADDLKVLFQQNIKSPCQYFTDELREVYDGLEKKSERKTKYDDNTTSRRGPLDLYGYEEFNLHLLGYQVCLRLTGRYERQALEQVAAHLKNKCR